MTRLTGVRKFGGVILWVGWVGGVLGAAEAVGEEPAGVSARRVRVERVVRTLASAEFGGRRGPAAARTAAWLVRRFEELGLQPLFGTAYEQPFGRREGGPEVGRNVGGWLEGADPQRRDEWVLVAAHFDHLGVQGGVLFPGADDNASGVAMLLELAGSFSYGDRPRRSVAFVAFDREEDGLWGSRFFVEHPPRPLERMRLMVVADMLGRSLGEVCTEHLFVVGSESVPGLRPWIRESAEGLPIRAGLIGSDLLLVDRSDYGPFRRRQLPYLFFTTGESPAYHTPEDRAETIDYGKLEAACTLIERVTRRAADSDEVPGWVEPPEHGLEEAEVVRDVLRRLLERGDAIGLRPLQRIWLEAQIRDLEAAMERGGLTAEERQRMVTNAQLVLYTIL